MERFDEGDLESILDHQATSAPGPLHRLSETTSLQTTTAVWERFGQ
jgi:hypothetical protein